MMRVENRDNIDKFFSFFENIAPKPLSCSLYIEMYRIKKHDSMQNISTKHCVGSLLFDIE
jgi:hypothetical protein